MKKIIISLSILSSLFASDKLLTKKELNEVLKSSFIYSKLKKDIDKKIVTVRGVYKDGFYIINIKTPKGSGNIYITKDKKYAILGNVIDNKSGSLLKANFPVNKEIVKKGVLFTFGKGEDIYVVTDPECPYCRMMEAKTKKNS